MHCRIIFAFTLYLCHLLPSQAQILNVEENRLHSDSVNQFYGNVKFRFHIHNRSATQSEKIQYAGLSLASQLGYQSRLHNHMLISDLKYNSVTGQPFIRTGYSHFRTNWFRENTVSYETFTQVQFDLGRGLNLRWLAGGGLRIKLIDSEDLHLNFGPGIMYERERWVHPMEKELILIKNLFKSTNYLSYFQKLGETTIFNLTLYLQTGHDQEADTWRQRYSFDTGLKFNIYKNVSFVADFAWAYESRPIVPILKYIYSLENGIVIDF